MSSLWMDVDAALAEVPVNACPLVDDTDFKTLETAVPYNAVGLELYWHFITPAGAYTTTQVTPTVSGVYDWAHQAHAMYTIEIPSSGGASINNNTEGFGYFTGVASGVLPWRGPTIGFRAAGLNDKLIEDAYSTTRGLAGTALPDVAIGSASGLVRSSDGTALIVASGVANARLADAVAHGGSTATLRLGSTSTSPLYITSGSSNDAVSIQCLSGNGRALSLVGAGTSEAVYIIGGGSSGPGMFITAGGGNGAGIYTQGEGTGPGLDISDGGGANGVAMRIGSYSDNGVGLEVFGGTAGDAVHAYTTQGTAVRLESAGTGVFDVHYAGPIAANAPPEASGRPTDLHGMVRRTFEWLENKRIRTRSTGSVNLRTSADDGTLSTQVQSTAGGEGSEVDTQTQGS